MAAGQAIRDEPLLVSAATRVTCPKCEAEFSLEEGFAKNALEGLEHASQQSLAAIRESERQAVEKRAQEIAGEQQRTSSQELSSLRQLLKDQSASHARALAEVQELAAKSVAPQIEALKAQLTDSQAQLTAMDQREAALVARERELGAKVTEEAATRAAELVAGEKANYEKRLAEREQQLQVLRTEQVSLREERQRLKDEKAAMALEVQRQVDARTTERETQVRTQEQERAALKEAELQKTIDDMAGKLAEAQAKASQGSQQLQGEVLELAIEERLKGSFPQDTIEEVKKGQRGGDVLQHVVTRSGHPAGTILWEMKRAKDWQVPWTSKLKEDMRASGAAVGVLVTMPGALPKDWSSGALFSLYEDVWVTQMSTAMGVGEVLRAGLIDVHRQRAAAAGKGERRATPGLTQCQAGGANARPWRAGPDRERSRTAQRVGKAEARCRELDACLTYRRHSWC